MRRDKYLKSLSMHDTVRLKKAHIQLRSVHFQLNISFGLESMPHIRLGVSVLQKNE